MDKDLSKSIAKLEAAIAELKHGRIGCNAARIRYFAAQVSKDATAANLVRTTRCTWDLDAARKEEGVTR